LVDDDNRGLTAVHSSRRIAGAGGGPGKVAEDVLIGRLAFVHLTNPFDGFGVHEVDRPLHCGKRIVLEPVGNAGSGTQILTRSQSAKTYCAMFSGLRKGYSGMLILKFVAGTVRRSPLAS
jgi:hypothetical protein